MRSAVMTISGAIALFLMIPMVARGATPSEKCDFLLLSASKAVDARKGGAPPETISKSVHTENEERRGFDAGVPDRLIDKFLRDLFSGDYDQMPSGLEFFDSAGPYTRRLQAECLKYF